MNTLLWTTLHLSLPSSCEKCGQALNHTLCTRILSSKIWWIHPPTTWVAVKKLINEHFTLFSALILNILAFLFSLILKCTQLQCYPTSHLFRCFSSPVHLSGISSNFLPTSFNSILTSPNHSAIPIGSAYPDKCCPNQQ